MARFICDNCGREFEEPITIKESRGEFWGMPAYEDIWVCPYCEDDSFYEVESDDEFMF